MNKNWSLIASTTFLSPVSFSTCCEGDVVLGGGEVPNSCQGRLSWGHGGEGGKVKCW